MKSIIFTLLLLIITSCRRQSEKIETIQDGFITETGIYYWGNKTIILKNIDENSKILGIVNEKNKIIYQQPLNMVFNNSHYWTLYAEGNQNIYFYNSDYSESQALIWNSNENKYEEKDFCKVKMDLPIEFVKELKSKATLINCKSF